MYISLYQLESCRKRYGSIRLPITSRENRATSIRATRTRIGAFKRCVRLCLGVVHDGCAGETADKDVLSWVCTWLVVGNRSSKANVG